MSESSPHWSGKSPLPLTLVINRSRLLTVGYLLLGAAAASCVLLLPLHGIAGVLQLAAPLPCAVYGAWLAAVHGLRLGPHAVTALTVLPDGTLRLGFGDGRVLAPAGYRVLRAHPLFIHLEYARRARPWFGRRRRALLIAGDALDDPDAHRALRAFLQRVE